MAAIKKDNLPSPPYFDYIEEVDKTLEEQVKVAIAQDRLLDMAVGEAVKKHKRARKHLESLMKYKQERKANLI